MRTFFVVFLAAACRGDGCRGTLVDTDTDPLVEIVDDDNDGSTSDVDCDDANPEAYPGAVEACDDVDNDCDDFVDEDAVDATTWYADDDADGYGDDEDSVVSCAAPSDSHIAEGGDCDDRDPDVHPGADEACDATEDLNCDGSVGFDDSDNDGTAACDDCDDTDPTVHPGAPELCDGVDDDCDDLVDEDAVDADVWYTDADRDGFGDPDASTTSCVPPPDAAANGDDCDDDDALAYPGADETCDGQDDDCDGGVDEEAVDARAWFADADGDGFAGDRLVIESCEPPEGYTDQGGDCDDLRDDVFPGATDACDAADNDCDDAVDEDAARFDWSPDRDGDGFGDLSTTIEACAAPLGWVSDGSDCDDLDAGVHPQQLDPCDDVDQDCDGDVDEDAVFGTWYADLDRDTHGDPDTGTLACAAPTGAVTTADDCDDLDPDVHPGATDVCNGVSDDCDAAIDEDAPRTTWYQDRDDDGYGDPLRMTTRCSQPAGWIAVAGDCDDLAPTVHPGAVDVCNGRSDDCDAAIDEDASFSAWHRDRDEDGFGDEAHTVSACAAPQGHVADATDCADLDPAVNPDAFDVCNGKDDDCDDRIDEEATGPTWYTDADGDGHGAGDGVQACSAPRGTVASADDCDDDEPAAWEDRPELCDGIDNDCDPSTLEGATVVVNDGSTTAGVDRTFQYSPVAPGGGRIHANWTAVPEISRWELAIGTTPGGTDVVGFRNVGNGTSATINAQVQGAWTDVVYYVTVRAAGATACAPSTSNGVAIAEGVRFTGNVAELRPNDAFGGSTANWPESGMNAVYGAHFFEEVDIAEGTVVSVQGWGRAQAVPEGVAAAAVAVTTPHDGWLALYANDVRIAGTITASGRGYGGGGGGGGGPSGPATERGRGGSNGLGGRGGDGVGWAGGGGGGSPGGRGGTSTWPGGNGGVTGAGGGGSGCAGSPGQHGGTGSIGTIGAHGATGTTSGGGAGGAGEFASGGGAGGAGCDNWAGGGGGGYGAGGGGGTQWDSRDAAGGGGGGTGGIGGGDTDAGGAGAGPYGGAGGGANASVGRDGGYAAAAGNGDTTTNRTIRLGSGGGGGGSGRQEAGGGGGGAGGGAIALYAANALVIEDSARLLANGAGAGGGGTDTGGAAVSFRGGAGAGGTVLLEAQVLAIDSVTPAISARGGSGQTSNGGSIKLFYGSFSGSKPPAAAAGRVHDGAGSFLPWSQQ